MTFRDEVEEESIHSTPSGKRDAALGKLKELIEDRGIDLDLIGEIKTIRVNEWQAMSKNAEGEPEITDLRAASIVLSPSWEAGPEWPVIDHAAPVQVKVPKERSGKGTGWKKCVILPDIQFGYRRLLDGTLDPFHDERACDIAIQVIERERPDLVILLGDLLDLAPVGRHRFEAGFAMTVQPALERAYRFLAKVAALAGEVRLLSGNHDERIQHYITDNAIHAFGLKKAGAVPEAWPVMSIPYLLNLEELGIEYVGAYPAGATYINDKLACIHGAKIGNRNRTAAQLVVEDEQVSVIYGHTHKRALAAKTRNSRGEPKFAVAYSPGCLCRIDGGVPSVKGGVDAFGRPIKSWEDWQQGIAVIQYMDTPDDYRFHIEEIPIFEQPDGTSWAMYRDREFIGTNEGGL